MAFSFTTARAQVQEPLEIVALGDSLTAGYQLPPGKGFVPQLQAALRARGHLVVVQNAGVSGDTSAGGLARLDWSIPSSASAVIVELGANDALRGVPPEVTRQNLTQIIETLKARGLTILLAGMYAPPNLGLAYANRFNPIYPELAKKYDLIYYPFFLDGVASIKSLNLADGIHPNADGIQIIVQRILPKAEQLIGRINK
jgi:acyl-CoA thioesterase-1